MFEGRYDHALDAKGRTMVPKEFRDHLAQIRERGLRITRGAPDARQLEVRTESSFAAYRDFLNGLPEDASLRKYKRYYVQNAISLELDANGRIVIPARLRQWASLGEKVTFVGLDAERFEIWRPEVFDADDDFVLANWESLRATLAPLEKSSGHTEEG